MTVFYEAAICIMISDFDSRVNEERINFRVSVDFYEISRNTMSDVTY